MEFSTKQDLRNNWPKVEWKDVVWFKQFNPRHAFILWLAVQGKLMTKDRVAKWQSNSCKQCALCKSGNDSHEHLFFKCKYTEEIWTRLGNLRWGMGVQFTLQEVLHDIERLKGKKNIGIVVNKLILADAVYFIWQERNFRIFQDKERSEEVVWNIIKESVRNKLLSIRVRKTKNVINIGDQWKLKWVNCNFVAD